MKKLVDKAAQCAYLWINKDGIGPDGKTKGDEMNMENLSKTHELITETATIGTPGYALDNRLVKIWNGDKWEDGCYRLMDNGELSFVTIAELFQEL